MSRAASHQCLALLSIPSQTPRYLDTPALLLSAPALQSPSTWPGPSLLLQHGFPGVFCLSFPHGYPASTSAHPLLSPHCSPTGHTCPTSPCVSCYTWSTLVTLPTSSVPTPNVSDLFPVNALLRRWHAPSPSTAYCIFGKTCSLLAMRHCESHLNTMALGVAWARLALPRQGAVPDPWPGSKGLTTL